MPSWLWKSQPRIPTPCKSNELEINRNIVMICNFSSSYFVNFEWGYLSTKRWATPSQLSDTIPCVCVNKGFLGRELLYLIKSSEGKILFVTREYHEELGMVAQYSRARGRRILWIWVQPGLKECKPAPEYGERGCSSDPLFKSTGYSYKRPWFSSQHLHVGWLPIVHDFSSRGSGTFFWTLQTPGLYAVHICTCKQYRHIKWKWIFLFFF